MRKPRRPAAAAPARRTPRRALPPEVPTVSAEPPGKTAAKPDRPAAEDPSEEAIRRMVEAAYT